MGKPITHDDLIAMITDGKTPAWDLDEAFWAHDRQVDYPLTHYDRETFEGCAREGDPSARAIGDPGALLRRIEEKWPGAQLSLMARDGKMRAAILIPGVGRGVEADFRGDFRLPDLGRGIAVAFLKADGMAIDLRRRLLAVEGLDGKAPPYDGWPVEEIAPGRFGAVRHDLKLLCATANSPEGAMRHAGMNHKGDYGLMLCRERYLKSFPDPEPGSSGPSP
jgi:hypothetical protein